MPGARGAGLRPLARAPAADRARSRILPAGSLAAVSLSRRARILPARRRLTCSAARTRPAALLVSQAASLISSVSRVDRQTTATDDDQERKRETPASWQRSSPSKPPGAPARCWVGRGPPASRSRGFPAAGRVGSHSQRALDGDHGRPAGVDGVDDLGLVDALQVNRGDAEVGAAELALDDDQRYPLAGHLDGVGVAEFETSGAVGSKRTGKLHVPVTVIGPARPALGMALGVGSPCQSQYTEHPGCGGPR